MDAEFIDLTAENIADEHLCYIIRMKKPHTGVEAKREWLAARLPEGHVFRKLNTGDCVFIEYAPLETAWVPVVGRTTCTSTACGCWARRAAADGRAGAAGVLRSSVSIHPAARGKAARILRGARHPRRV